MTAKFKSNVPIIRDNIISAHLGAVADWRSGDFYIEVESSYPLASDIMLNYRSYGSYWEPSNVEGERPVSRNFDADENITLKAGERSWSIKVFIGSGGWFDGYDGEVNWDIYFNDFSDNSFKYKLGTRGGNGTPS